VSTHTLPLSLHACWLASTALNLARLEAYAEGGAAQRLPEKRLTPSQSSAQEYLAAAEELRNSLNFYSEKYYLLKQIIHRAHSYIGTGPTTGSISEYVLRSRSR
jgi:hypothetical protein